MCRYQEWNRSASGFYGVFGRTKAMPGMLTNCSKPIVSDGLCQEHLEWVADCKDMAGIDRKYPYRVKGKPLVKLEKPNVKETITPPSNRRLEFIAWKAGAPKARGKYSFKKWELDEAKREKEASEPSPYTAHGMAEIQARKIRADRADMAKQIDEHVSFGTIPDSSEALEVFGRFLVLKPVAPNASACAYFDRETGIKLAITLEGVRRMGPQVVNRIVSARMGR